MSPISRGNLDLAIDLPARGSRRVVRELHRQLRAAIVGGRLRPGLRLPASRELASALNVSRNTIVNAYDLLLAEGYVSAKGRAGTIVVDFLSVPSSFGRPTVTSARDSRLSAAWRGSTALIPTATRRGCRFDFAVGIPDWESFPFALWHRLEGRALRSAARSHPDYGEPQGRLALRQAIAGHISFARAIACAPEEIVVTAGAQQAFDLIARILVTPGRTTVAIEEPGYIPLRNVLAAAGARIVPVPVDGEGLRVDRLPQNAKLIFVTPSHQFPMGVHLSLARRRALLDFARARGTVIVEDDYDGEFRYLGKPLDALQTLDRHGAVFYVGTFSKSMFPALRLGFVIAPSWAREALVAAKQLSDWHAPLVAQDTLAAFIVDGHLARHVRKMRKIYGERREILQAALERFCGGLRVIGIGAGLHLAAQIDPSVATAGLIERAREAGIALDPMQRFALGRRKSDGLVFGYGAISADRIVEGVRVLARLMK
ncbi:MAG TPA: PLP-dependent aminotransferase family protein [Casimicrobiaceae bacterium]|jgi:GntR family transcriptional regulator/MocR family aminotransferase|nr:PLP-dependent aminotransferase family protein [Casimicrobiaceae bacterium]